MSPFFITVSWFMCNVHSFFLWNLVFWRITVSMPIKKTKPIKLASQSPHVSYFMPMLEGFAAKGELNEILKNCVVKSCDILDSGVPLFPNDFRKEDDCGTIRAEYEGYSAEELENIEVELVLAGRIVSSRSFGKVIFFHIQDRTGRLQCYAEKELLGEEVFKVFKKLDVGDIVGVKGSLFRTKTGELTLSSTSIRLLTKSFRTLPNKHEGLTNVEIRFRQRYVDLIVNPRARDVFRKRSKIVREFRNFMEDQGFIEVETPMMHPIAGGAAARPFITHHNALDMELYLRIAPELYLKRLIVGGLEKVFEINRSFRNEGTDTTHNPEFTMCEFYWAYSTFTDLMDLTEALFARISNAVCGSTQIVYQEQPIDLTPGKWERITFHDSLQKYGGHTPAFYNDIEEVKAYLYSRGERKIEGIGIGKLQSMIFDLDVEGKLIQPTFVYFYPAEISPLARRNDDNPELTDRFELFIAGREMANAFSELNDPVDQRQRFELQVEAKAAGDDEANLLDDDYLRALEYGMPPTAGEGIGIDRLVMLLTDSASIREVIFFPHLRPEI